jgi:VWFA-related protein
MRRGATVLAAVLLARPEAHAPAQEPSRVFPARVEQVTVDVVVVDKKGEPVAGLTREDFTILDEGRPREVLTFEQVGSSVSGPADVGTPPSRPRVATNLEPPAERGRLFVVAFDDVHLSPLNAQRAKAAVAAFIDRGAQAGDRVLLLATGGAAWWSARLPAGRADLLEALKRLDGRRILDNARERMTDYEAVQIALYRDVGVARRVQERFERYGGESLQAMQRSQQQAGMQGYLDPYIEQRASEAYLSLRARMSVTLGILERCFESLERSRERKSVLLVSEGFAHDYALDARRRAVEAARRANAALYFVDTRGLDTSLTSTYSAEFGAPFEEEDLMAAVADVSREGDGAEALASDTGGFAIRDTNDFAAGAVRIGRESRTHYLLGYDPGEIPADGRFRKIEVRLRRKGLALRARRGYYAPSGTEAAAPADKRGHDPDLQRALDAPGIVPDIPLRVSAFVQEDATAGTARVVFAAEADIARLPAAETAAGPRTTLDTLIVAAHRDDAEFTRTDRQAELERRPAPPGTPVWYAFTRELELKPGAHQVKLIVRDVASRKLGSVMLKVEVPALRELRVSTPILASALSTTRDGGLVPQLRVRRDFPPGAALYCSFEVFGAAHGPDGLPRVTAGHALRRPGGAELGSTPPNPIRPTSIGALSRLIQIPLAGRAVGDYELVLTVTDEIAGRTREVVEPFSIAEPAGSGGR